MCNQWFLKWKAYEIHNSHKIPFLDNESHGREINLQARVSILIVFFKGIYTHSEVRQDKITPLMREIKMLLTTDGELCRNALYVALCIIILFYL